jgi:RHS repeat-associated protein
MTLPNGISTAYSYDAVGRLTEMKYSKDSTVLRDLVYGYDEINRRTSYSGNTAPAPRDTATDTATVNALNQYTSRNGKPVSHDDNANQTINNAVWDARNRLVSLSGPGFTASFTYDEMGRRTSKTVNGQKKTYLYDGSDLISETGADYTFGPGIDQPLERKSGQNEYYLSDALGSVIGLADANGAVQTSYNYSPFGKKQTTGAASGNTFAFTGREDDGTGYYYYRARYYNPDQKRFIAEDPLGFGGGNTNLQAYVGNNPIGFVDPEGTLPTTAFTPRKKSYLNSKSQPFNVMTDGLYKVSRLGMSRHETGKPDKSQFFKKICSKTLDELILDGSALADHLDLWYSDNPGEFKRKAKIHVDNGPVGVLQNGQPTNWINLYREERGLDGLSQVHAAPGTPPATDGGALYELGDILKRSLGIGGGTR